MSHFLQSEYTNLIWRKWYSPDYVDNKNRGTCLEVNIPFVSHYTPFMKSNWYKFENYYENMKLL